MKVDWFSSRFLFSGMKQASVICVKVSDVTANRVVRFETRDRFEIMTLVTSNSFFNQVKIILCQDKKT